MKKILFLICMLILLPSFAEETKIENLTQYFEYLPNAVHKNWTPYKAEKDYEVLVQFRVLKNGEITKPEIVNSTNERANSSVLRAVQTGAPYKPLPQSYKSDSVKTQIQLQYIKDASTSSR